MRYAIDAGLESVAAAATEAAGEFQLVPPPARANPTLVSGET